MKQQLELRLQRLKAEQETGNRYLADLAAKQVETNATLLRIAGAIQVLEELLAQTSEEAT